MIEEIKKRKLPDVLKLNNGQIVQNEKDWETRRKEMKQLLMEEEYGYFPEKHAKIEVQIVEQDDHYCGGTASYKNVKLTLILEKGKFSFPIHVVIPKKKNPCPAFLYIDFYQNFPNKYLPVEEICDNGFAIISFCYENITSDDQNYSNGLSQFFYHHQSQRKFSKIGLWSWAAMHVMDYLQTLEQIDPKNIAIIGHSRLGKTALLTGAFDERFQYTISNNSGQSGAAISRGKEGETIKAVYTRFPHWFCSNYEKYAEKEQLQPFDQHYLLALIAPRNLYVASASEDKWADPVSEFLCCVAINPVYELLHEKGLIYTNDFPKIGKAIQEGKIGYHLREGWHYLSRYDWNQFMKYIKNKRM